MEFKRKELSAKTRGGEGNSLDLKLEEGAEEKKKSTNRSFG